TGQGRAAPASAGSLVHRQNPVPRQCSVYPLRQACSSNLALVLNAGYQVVDGPDHAPAIAARTAPVQVAQLEAAVFTPVMRVTLHEPFQYSGTLLQHLLLKMAGRGSEFHGLGQQRNGRRMSQGSLVM